jgi:TIR domain
VAWQLIDAGYAVVLDVWDWAAGRNFVTAMSDALERCDRVVALFSAAYFDRSRYTTDEWSATALHVPDAAEGSLVPVRVEEVLPAQVPRLLRTLVCRDLFGVGEEQARWLLLEAAGHSASQIIGVMLILKGYGHHCNVHPAEQGPSAQPDTGRRA